MAHSLIVASNIKKIFSHGTQSIPILRGVNATFMSGKSYAITGISGSGKSSLLHIIAGFDEPTSGTILFNGVSIHSFSQREKEHYLQRTIGFLFQKPYLIKELSVIENIMLPMHIAGDSPEYIHKRARELLDVVGLISYEHYKPGVLSGGQQQRVCLARALANKPLFLYADEPTASLDARSRDEIITLIQYGMSTWGMGVIVCAHDPVVSSAMQHQFLLQDGILQPLT